MAPNLPSHASRRAGRSYEDRDKDDSGDEELMKIEDEPYSHQGSVTSEDVSDDIGDDISDNDDAVQVVEEGSVDDDEDEEIERQLSNVSFGALLGARESLSRKRKYQGDQDAEQSDKLEALRKRLRQLKQEKTAAAGTDARHPEKRAAQSRNESTYDDGIDIEDDNDNNSSGSAPSEENLITKSRTSKHAPTAQSSRRQVSRKRVVVDVPKRNIRDPRFDTALPATIPNGNVEKAYGFLVEYQKAEIAELKAAIKRCKDDGDRETLRRKLNSMENKLKAKATKEREQEVLRRHRKEEREKVQQGKAPYFLKKKELKERALVEKFRGMKGKEREKLLEKRRRRDSQKEKKRMPAARRIAE